MEERSKRRGGEKKGQGLVIVLLREVVVLVTEKLVGMVAKGQKEEEEGKGKGKEKEQENELEKEKLTTACCCCCRYRCCCCCCRRLLLNCLKKPG